MCSLTKFHTTAGIRWVEAVEGVYFSFFAWGGGGGGRSLGMER